MLCCVVLCCVVLCCVVLCCVVLCCVVFRDCTVEAVLVKRFPENKSTFFTPEYNFYTPIPRLVSSN